MQAPYSGQHGLHNLAGSTVPTPLSTMLALVCQLCIYSLNSIFIFFALSVKMDLGPINMFPVIAGMILSFVSRDNGRGTAGGKNSASLFWCSGWAHSQVLGSYGMCGWASAELQQCAWLPQCADPTAWVFPPAPALAALTAFPDTISYGTEWTAAPNSQQLPAHPFSGSLQ